MQQHPTITTATARNHWRNCATGPHLIITMATSEVRNLCCDVDALVTERENLFSVLKEIHTLVSKKQPIPTAQINSILEQIGMYQQL